METLQIILDFLFKSKRELVSSYKLVISSKQWLQTKIIVNIYKIYKISDFWNDVIFTTIYYDFEEFFGK